MITVIKNGKFGEKQAIECGVCGCEFTFECTDMNWSDEGGSANVVCPQCKEYVLVAVENEFKYCRPYVEETRML